MSYPITTRKIIQGNEEFFLGIFKMDEVRKFTRFTARILIQMDENNYPIYNNDVQRKLKNTKVEEIANFLIHDKKATFPTNIVIAVPDNVIDELVQVNDDWIIHLNDKVLEEVKKQNGDVYLSIIDGQHRIAGIERALEKTYKELQLLKTMLRETNHNSKYEEQHNEQERILKKLLDFQLIITFFKSPTIEYQAMIFSTINRTQTKVPINLVYNLFGLSSSPTPQKSALEITLGLNASEKSPFYNRLKLAGATYKRGESPPLSQSTIVKTILLLICPSIKQSEIERHKSRQYLRENWFKNLPFRKYYTLDKDDVILKILFSYFSAVRKTFLDNKSKSYWDMDHPVKNILHTTVGFEALMMLLKDILQRKHSDEELITEKIYLNYLEKAKKLDIEDNNDPKKYPFDSQSKKSFYKDLYELVFQKPLP